MNETIINRENGLLPSVHKHAARFWSNVTKTETCWIYNGSAPSVYGYNHVWIEGKRYRAHRVAWYLTYGETRGLFVCHKCDNRRCVRPDHLFLGTAQDNTDDAVRKGRIKNPPPAPHPCGSDHPQAKLRDNDVIEILRQRSSGLTMRELADRFGVSTSSIGRICIGQQWKKLQGGLNENRS